MRHQNQHAEDDTGIILHLLSGQMGVLYDQIVCKEESKNRNRKLCFPDVILFSLLHAFTMVEVFNCVTGFLWFSGQSRTINKYLILILNTCELLIFEITQNMENEDNIFSSGALPFSSALLPLRLLQMNSAKPTLFFILYSELQEKTAPVLGL